MFPECFPTPTTQELRLMVKGLVGGFRTLFLSFALLFAVLYAAWSLPIKPTEKEHTEAFHLPFDFSP